jgi:1,4-dihydroxy-2-naphthoate octaprenyltransferase
MDMTLDMTSYIIATRPWSFTAAAIPILLTAAVTRTPILSLEVLQALAVGIFVQAGANLTNTYYDFINGIDTKDNPADSSIVEGKVSKRAVFFLSYLCYAAGIFLASPVLIKTDLNDRMIVIFAVGLILAYFYTAKPVGLKYMALGDITIFLCFGPLLMQFTSLLLTGDINKNIYVYSVPIGLYTEAILHANNARDIKADSKAGATTLATLVGKDLSYVFYQMLFVSAYLGAVAIALWHNWGVVASLATVPLSANLVSLYKAGKMQELPEETAKAHLPFGITMLLGILFTHRGALSLLQS